MKKLALLLGSLLVVGVTAQAKEVIVAPVEESKEIVVVAEPVVEEVAVVVEEPAPAFRATNFGMWTENDNTAGHEDGDIGLTYLGMSLGLASENWTHGIEAYKAWTLDTDEGVISGKDDSRLQITSMRSFNKDSEFKYSLGTRFRLNKTYDRYYLKGKYSYGMLGGWADLAYTSRNEEANARDSYYLETMPLNMTFGPLTVGYFFYAEESVGSNAAGERTPSTIEHQLRAYFPLFSAGKFSSDVEIRLGLDKDNKAGDRNSKTEADYGFGDLQRYALNLGYEYSESLSFSTYYLYQITKFDTDKRNDYYGEFGAGWNYKF